MMPISALVAIETGGRLPVARWTESFYTACFVEAPLGLFSADSSALASDSVAFHHSKEVKERAADPGFRTLFVSVFSAPDGIQSNAICPSLRAVLVPRDQSAFRSHP